jgi:hypothetical protein
MSRLAFLKRYSMELTMEVEGLCMPFVVAAQASLVGHDDKLSSGGSFATPVDHPTPAGLVSAVAGSDAGRATSAQFAINSDGHGGILWLSRNAVIFTSVANGYACEHISIRDVQRVERAEIALCFETGVIVHTRSGDGITYASLADRDRFVSEVGDILQRRNAAQRVLTEDGETRMSMVVFENQRAKTKTMTSMTSFSGSWTDADMDKHDPGLLPWSDNTGRSIMGKDIEPLAGYMWRGEWFVDLTVPGEVDEDGWQYAANYASDVFASSNAVTDRKAAKYRRRCWARFQLPIDSDLGDFDLDGADLLDEAEPSGSGGILSRFRSYTTKEKPGTPRGTPGTPRGTPRGKPFSKDI